MQKQKHLKVRAQALVARTMIRWWDNERGRRRAQKEAGTFERRFARRCHALPTAHLPTMVMKALALNPKLLLENRDAKDVMREVENASNQRNQPGAWRSHRAWKA